MSNLNQSEAEKLAKIVAEAIFDSWQKNNGITKDTIKEIVVEELTKKRPEPAKASPAYNYMGLGCP